MHHVLYFAKMLVSDSQTMTIEAAILGVPSVRYNSLVGRISSMQELEYKYDLSYGFTPGHEEDMLKKLQYLLNKKNLQEECNRNREKLLKDKEDMTKIICDLTKIEKKVT